jgi:DNA end-binding protein Ku
MASRPTWKGHLRLSLVSCAVTLSPATTDSRRISFHLLNPRTQNRVKQQYVDAETGTVVDNKSLVKGYEIDGEQHVVIDDDELDKIKLESTHTIDIERFVERAEVDGIYYNKPYFMVPDGKVSEEAYAVIREAMRRQGKVAIARLVLSAREHVVAIEPTGEGMSVTTLRAPNEVQSAKLAFEDIRKAKVTPEMLKLAESIIADKVGPFEPSMFEDRYQAALQEIVEAKTAGRKPALPRTARPSNVVNLMDALRRSVRQSHAKPAAPAKPTATRRAPKAGRSAASRRQAS